MRSRLVILRRALTRPSPIQPSPRTFTQNTPVRLALRTRPQLPFLSVPTGSRQRVRYLTTQRKAWLRHEFALGIRYIIYIGIGAAACTGLVFALHQESLERQCPTPPEWSFLTRVRFRVASFQRDMKSQGGVTDWVAVIQHIEAVVRRLENPRVDGGLLTEVVGTDAAKDISAKSEPWRRGYFEALMVYAKAAEYVDGWQLDKKRGIVFPPGVVIGPANPFPMAIPAGSPSAPRQEDCETAYPSPGIIYNRILSTEGWTPCQRIEANLAYASWMEYSQDLGAAKLALETAVQIAAADIATQPFDPKTFVLKDSAGPPSANILKTISEYATFHARTGDVAFALPILVSILKARRSLSLRPAEEVVKTAPNPLEDPFSKLWRLLKAAVAPPAYPPPPDDGRSPPSRDSKEQCEEAALHLYIGEIMYTAQASGREEGLAWTRDAVDLAEEQLRQLKSAKKIDVDAKTTCRECLATGLGNWTNMVERLAREEAVKQQTQSETTAGWFGLWRDSKAEDFSRWAAEGKVIAERQRRLKELLEDIEPPKKGFASIFKA